MLTSRWCASFASTHAQLRFAGGSAVASVLGDLGRGAIAGQSPEQLVATATAKATAALRARYGTDMEAFRVDLYASLNRVLPPPPPHAPLPSPHQQTPVPGGGVDGQDAAGSALGLQTTGLVLVCVLAPAVVAAGLAAAFAW